MRKEVNCTIGFLKRVPRKVFMSGGTAALSLVAYYPEAIPQGNKVASVIAGTGFLALGAAMSITAKRRINKRTS